VGRALMHMHAVCFLCYVVDKTFWMQHTESWRSMCHALFFFG